ncbi:unnamed protein product [Phaeothamnion confervicola]
MDMAAADSAGEQMMREMAAEFEKLGEKDEYNEVVDNILQQLLSKELMYDPIKQVCDKYPEWLAQHRARFTQEEYTRYGTQYQYFQRVLAVYETEPDNFPRLMELLQDLQEHGQAPHPLPSCRHPTEQVPADIIKELAPGLEFNAEGMPVMPNMGLPGLAGLGGLAGLPGMDPQSCAVM